MVATVCACLCFFYKQAIWNGSAGLPADFKSYKSQQNKNACCKTSALVFKSITHTESVAIS